MADPSVVPSVGGGGRTHRVQVKRPVFDDVIADLYEAAASNQPLDEPLRRLCMWRDARDAGVSLFDAARPGPPLYAEYTLRDPDFQKLYYGTYVHHSPLRLPLGDVPVGRAVTDCDLIDRSAFERSTFYNEYLRRFGIGRIMIAWLTRDAHTNGTLFLYRSAGDPAFSVRDRALFSKVSRHAERALRLRALGGGAPAISAFLSSLETLSSGGLLVDDAGRIRELNACARTILASGDGLTIKAGQLSCAHPHDDRALRDLLGRIRAGVVQGGELKVRRFGAAWLDVQLYAMPHASASGGLPRTAALVVVRDRREPAASSAERWADDGLTPAECRVALRLAAGDAPQAICAALGIGMNSLKTHRMRIYAKLGVTSQAQLAALATAATR